MWYGVCIKRSVSTIVHHAPCHLLLGVIVGAVWVLHPQKWREEGKVKQHLSGPI